MNCPYKVLATKYATLGRFRIRLDTVNKDDNLYSYSYIEQKNSVGILAFVDNNIILIKQYRHSLGSYEYEIPGGGVEINDDPLTTAKNELVEETGYQVDHIEALGEFYPSPGSSNEVCYLFLASCSKSTFNNLEPLELISVELISESELEKKIFGGKIKHSMCLVSWLLYKMRKKNEFS